MQRRRDTGPVAVILLALVTGALAGCAPSSATGPEEARFQEHPQGLSGSEPYLVRDINPAGVGSIPQAGAVAALGQLFFTRYSSGWELWKSDGTEAGTVRVKRFQGEVSSLRPLRVAGNAVFFYDNTRLSLWKSDGTEAGTVLLTPQSSSGGMGNLPQVRDSAALNGRLYLLTAASLWVSDGTEAGTVMLKGFPTAGTFSSQKMVAINGLLFFTVNPASGGSELWKSDGTAAGTVMLETLSNEPTNTLTFFNTELAAVNNTLFATAYANGVFSLWKSDGTAEGTTVLHDGLSYPGGLTVSNGRLFYAAASSLWATDGTKDGTLKLTSGNIPGDRLMATSGGVVFPLYSNGTDMTLWWSNGTVAGTAQLGDPCPDGPEGYVSRLASVNGAAFFQLDCGTTRSGLWRSDGSVFGTARVTDLPLRMTFSTSSGNTATYSAEVDGKLLFWADDDVHGPELWKSDGTALGTVLVRDLEPTFEGSDPRDFVTMGGSLFFTATGRTSTALWKSDGTQAGTVGLTSLYLDDKTALLTPVNGTLYFTQHPGQLWKSDGTQAGTQQITTITSSKGYAMKLLALVDFGGTLFFAVQDEEHTELWKSDGTQAGTVRVKELPLPTQGSRVAWPRVVNGSLFFIVGDGSLQGELWKSDGTEAGTMSVKPLFNDPSSVSRVKSVAAVNGKYFVLTHKGLWMSDGTGPGTTLLTDITERVQPIAIAELGETLLLVSNEREATGLWKSNGTAAGTTRLRTLLTKKNDLAGSEVLYSASVRGRLYFTLYSPARKDYELWRSDGTAQGTGMVHAMTLGTGYYNSQTSPLFAEAGKRLFFVHDGGQGREPWALPLAPVDCPPTLVAQASGPDGSPVDFPSVRRADDVDPALPISYSHASGSQFPLGDTPVTLTASDPAYPADTCTFTVSVQDSIGPRMQCPEDITVLSPKEGEGVAVPYEASATDIVSSTPTLAYSHPPGSTFPIGSTTVEVKATDAAGNVSACVFKVDVTPAPTKCGCGSTSPTAALGWLMVLVPLVLRRRGARVTL